MNFIEFSKINNLSTEMINAVYGYCNNYVIDPSSLIYSDKATNLAYVNVFIVYVNILEMVQKYPEIYTSSSIMNSTLILPTWQDYLDFDLNKLDYEIEHIEDGKMQMASPNKMIGIIMKSTISKSLSKKAEEWVTGHEIGHLISRDSIRAAQLKPTPEDDEYYNMEILADQFATMVTRGEYNLQYEDINNKSYKEFLFKRLEILNGEKCTKKEIEKMMTYYEYDNDPFMKERITLQNSFAESVRNELRKNQANIA